MEAIADLLVMLATVYVAIGLAFAVPFVLRGVNRIDLVARQGTWGFRLILVPGVVAFWPLLAWRWLGGRNAPAENNAHRTATRSDAPR